MRSVFGMILIYLVIKVFLLVMGIGIGLLMHWLVPGVDSGIGILIGLAATALSLHFYARLTSALDKASTNMIEIVPPPFIPPYPQEPIRTRRKSRR